MEAVIAAEEYISILEKTAVAQGTIQQKLEAKNEQLTKDLADLEAREKAWYNNPFINIALGVIIGVAVSK